MRVELTAEAEGDLAEIARYIAQDDVRKAIEFIHELRSACEGFVRLCGTFRTGSEVRAARNPSPGLRKVSDLLSDRKRACRRVTCTPRRKGLFRSP